MATVNPGPAHTQTKQTVEVQTPVNTNNNPVVQGSNALRLLACAKGINLNAIGDTVMPVINAAQYSVFQAVLTNASISLTTASIGIFTGAAGTGTTIRANAISTANTGPTVVAQLATIVTTKIDTTTAGSNLYLRVATPQGAAATADLFIYGYDLSA